MIPRPRSLTLLLLISALTGCPGGGPGGDAAARFEPDPLDLGEHRAIEELPAFGEVAFLNDGGVRLHIHEIGAADPWLEVRPTAEIELPIAVDPQGWFTLEVAWVGTPELDRTDYSSTITAEVSPPRGDSAFAEVFLVTGGVDLAITCDADGDGHAAPECGGEDCDDLDPDHSPDTPELCNGLDDDCDGEADASGGEEDADGDGFRACEDCDDGDSAVFPGAVERCNGIDDDCDPDTEPEGGEQDFDSDGFPACAECDDMDHDNAPGNIEVCDGADNDCDGLPSPEELDDDGDGWSECDGDCDDTTLLVHPEAEETAGDGIDSNCDGED